MDFELGGRKFQISKINALDQFHIARRMGPILADIVPIIQQLNKKKLDTLSEDEKLDSFGKLASPFMVGLAKLSDEDAEIVLFGLLSCAEIQGASGAWMKITNKKLLLAQDLELPHLINIAGHSFMHNISGFFGGVPR